MPKNSKNSFQAFNDFFAKAPSKNQKSWSLLNDFYDLLLTYMDDNEISQADLAKKLNCSRSAVSQMFSKKPNISLKKVVDIADAIGIEIKFVSEQVPSRIPKKLLNKTMDMARRSLVMELDPA